MRELLEKWAALEPRWCQVDDERATVMADVGKPLERPRFGAQYHRLGGYEADILASVIEAIEARPAWEWTLWSDGRDREATVHVIEAAGIIRRNYSTGLTAAAPAEALLTAYLRALEAEGATLPPAVES